MEPVVHLGLAKRWMQQQIDQGWSFTSKHVCAGCVDDYALEAAISAAQDIDVECDFCGGSPAAELDVLLELFVEGVCREYGSADAEGVSYVTREGGYQWDVLDTWDVVHECGADVLVGDGLLEAVCGAMEDQCWVPVDFIAPRRDEALYNSWQRFCDAVQHRTRYVFWLQAEEELEHGEVSPARILEHVGEFVDRFGLVTELPAGTRVWRALTHPEPQVSWNARRLGTAPRELARQANRMSPAGIPMFYGAFDFDTALRETSVRGGEPWATAGEFEISHSCFVVDFTGVPSVPSMFDPDHAADRRTLIFLHSFIEALSKPARSLYEQIDYVPTQVVTEYLLHVFRPSARVAGLLYSSSLTGGVAAVLNVPHDRCVDSAGEVQEGEVESLRMILDPASLCTGPSFVVEP
ncbi:HEPN-associated N-terminal domain-containing protein [Streptomyces sp. NBC_01233]|uniref:HEPN-associated N-terminal domain-containing protein n=1 Tax=Streptomyces sp. NBC_01233 TaxID=2903787 RepID=UPI002E131B97|nr:HEPN-associated N-terminal domain-containing protein [Streptomyces sp. NBC_01233]